MQAVVIGVRQTVPEPLRSPFNDMIDSDPQTLFNHVVQQSANTPPRAAQPIKKWD
jgi:hypothetical protein